MREACAPSPPRGSPERVFLVTLVTTHLVGEEEPGSRAAGVNSVSTPKGSVQVTLAGGVPGSYVKV